MPPFFFFSTSNHPPHSQAATEGLLKSALTCGTLSMAGDLLAQGLGHHLQVRRKEEKGGR
jgi:hypothetical protein